MESQIKEEKQCPFFSFGQMVVLCIEVKNKRRKASPEEHKLSCGLYELEHLWGIWTEVYLADYWVCGYGA